MQSNETTHEENEVPKERIRELVSVVLSAYRNEKSEVSINGPVQEGDILAAKSKLAALGVKTNPRIIGSTSLDSEHFYKVEILKKIEE